MPYRSPAKQRRLVAAGARNPGFCDDHAAEVLARVDEQEVFELGLQRPAAAREVPGSCSA